MHPSLQKQITAIASFSENELEKINACFEYEKFDAKDFLSSMEKSVTRFFSLSMG